MKLESLGDEAVARYTEKFDGVKLEQFAVSMEEIDEASGGLREYERSIIEEAEQISAPFMKNS